MMSSRFKPQFIRPTPYMKALKHELVSLLKREEPLTVEIAQRRTGIVKGDTSAFDIILDRALRSGHIKRTDDLLEATEEAEAR